MFLRPDTCEVNLLALETSGIQGSIAALVDDTLVSEIELPDDCRSARSLAPTVRHLLEKVNWTPRQIDLIAVTLGPGSFTGLRVGVTTAKTLAYAINAKTIGVNTLDVIARQAPAVSDNGDLHVVMDAQRKQFFSASYRLVDGVLRNVKPTTIIDRESWTAQLSDECTVTGPGLSRCDEQELAARVVSSVNWMPRAETVGRLGKELYLSTGEDDLWKLSPQYYRRSAAEEKLKKS